MTCGFVVQIDLETMIVLFNFENLSGVFSSPDFRGFTFLTDFEFFFQFFEVLIVCPT